MGADGRGFPDFPWPLSGNMKKVKRTGKVPFFITILAPLRSNYQSRFHHAVNRCLLIGIFKKYSELEIKMIP